MQWVSERGFYLIYTMLNILSAIALENGRGNSNKMHRITLGNFMSFVTWFNQLKVKFGNFYNRCLFLILNSKLKLLKSEIFQIQTSRTSFRTFGLQR